MSQQTDFFPVLIENIKPDPFKGIPWNALSQAVW